jgi:hypothetical protein
VLRLRQCLFLEFLCCGVVAGYLQAERMAGRPSRSSRGVWKTVGVGGMMRKDIFVP